MEDDFFNQHNNQGQNSPTNEQQHATDSTAAGTTFAAQDTNTQHIDNDIFGAADSNVAAQDNTASNNVNAGNAQDDFFGSQQGYVQQQQNNYAAFGDSNLQSTQNQNQDPDFFDVSEATPQQLTEHEQRKLRLQKEEQERTGKLIEKQNQENIEKNKRISAAKAYLQNWKSEKDLNIQTRKTACLQEEEVLVESRKKITYKNPWEKITENISLKASDVLGAKDVSRMKESILNKKADLAAAVAKN